MMSALCRRATRGQALVESALLTAIVVMVVIFGMSSPWIPGQSQSLLSLLFDGLGVYFESWAFLLAQPLL